MKRLLFLLALASACGASPAPAAPALPAPSETVVAESAPPEPPSAPPWTLVAGGVTACASGLPGGPACWGSWSDAVAEDVDFDPHALRAIPDGILEIAPGWAHTCWRTARGVGCEGRTERDSSFASEPAELADATHLRSGRDFTCGLRADGTLACTTTRPHLGLAPSVAPTGLRALATCASGWQLCALAEGMAWCWSSLDRPPTGVALPPGASDLVLAAHDACVRDDGGAVWCWMPGEATAQRVDDVHATSLAALDDRVCAHDGDRWACLTPRDRIATIVPWLDGARAIAAGMGFVCGAYADGVRCRGNDDFGQLGAFGAPPPGPAAAPPRLEARGASGLALERARACLLTAEGRVACWDEGAPRVVPGVTHAVALRSGAAHTCARTERGDVRCWGTVLVDHGEDVDPVWRDFSAGRRIATGALALATGDDDVCVVRGTPPALRCWGSPFEVPGDEWLPLAEPARALSTGSAETCVVGTSGTAWCVESGSSELAIREDWRGADVLVATDEISCSIVAGEVRCAGRNERGELGDGTRTPRAHPVRAHGITGAVGVALGDAHVCALLASGEVRCAGANEAGQLGDGTRVDRWRPVTVQGVAHAVEIAAAGSTSCARLDDESVVCWGAALGETIDESELEGPRLFP